MENINFCTKYPVNKSTIKNKITVTTILSLIAIMTIINSILVNKLYNNLLDLVVLILIVLAPTYALYRQIHRLNSYDEICIEDGYFIVKKENQVKSKTKLLEIKVTSFLSIVSYTGVPYITIKDKNNKKLFHYRASELQEEDHKKLMDIFENQIREIKWIR